MLKKHRYQVLSSLSFFLGKHLFLHQGTSRNFCLPFMNDVMVFLFSIQFLKLKHFAHIYSISLASCKIKLLDSNGNYFRQKQKISTAKTFTLNYFPPNVFRVTHHHKLKYSITLDQLQKLNFA